MGRPITSCPIASRPAPFCVRWVRPKVTSHCTRPKQTHSRPPYTNFDRQVWKFKTTGTPFVHVCVSDPMRSALVPTNILAYPQTCRPNSWHSMRSPTAAPPRSEEHTSELQSRGHLVCRLLLEKKKHKQKYV